MSSPKLNISEELAHLIRGMFAAPVLSALGRLSAFDVMLAKEHFTADDFPAIPNKTLLTDSFEYLSRVRLLSNQGAAWQLTELGKQVFQRANSFYVPHSYHPYMENFFDLLTGKKKDKPDVDRAENVIGSGRTHLRYFPFATSFLKRRVSFDVILDIGCGDGGFLSTVLKAAPGKTAVGVDFSPVSVQMTRERLRREYPSNEIEILQADAFDVEKWSKEVLRVAGKRPVAISMWFLIHEISQKNPARMVEFLNKVHRLFPEAPLVVCEIVRHENEVLAKNCRESIMPEYLFFHDISGQGVLSWDEYKQILQSSPYEIQSEHLFDEIPDSAGRMIPSSFVWCLTPKRK